MRAASLLLLSTAVAATLLTCAYAGDDGSAPVARPGKGAKPLAADLPKTKPAGQSSDEAGRIMEVVVTGAGSTPDEAVQSAYSAAIEQVVGVLVDAETLVKNDQVVSDKVLTFSRGFVQSYDEVKRWDKGGIHYVRIRAKVAVDKLEESLKGSKITTREVPGELIARQIRFDFKNEEDAAKMLDKVLDGFDMTKLTKVEVVGKPEITRDGANAKMQIKATVSPDIGEWQKFSKDLRLLLNKTAIKRGAFTIKGSQPCWFQDDALAKQVNGEGVLVALYTSVSGNRTQWNLYRVPQPLGDVVENASKHQGYKVSFVLLTQEGKEVARSSVKLLSLYNTYSDDNYISRPIVQLRMPNFARDNVWFVGPVWTQSDDLHTVFDVQDTFSLSQEDLGKVAKVSVVLEKSIARK